MRIDLVRVLHDNMEAEVFLAGESAWIQVSSGLRQRCKVLVVQN